MNSMLQKLDTYLTSSHSLTPKNDLGELVHFQLFPKLENILSKVTIGHIQKEKEPNAEKINKALKNLLDGPDKLSRNDWRLIFWGLNYEVGDKRVLDTYRYFIGIKRKIDTLISTNELSKRDWIGLCASYFDHSDPSEDDGNWLFLRNALANSFAIIEKNQTKPKPWIEVVKSNNFLLSDVADSEFVKLIIANDTDRISTINQIFPISDASWLWKKAFSSLEAALEKIGDEKFLIYLPSLIDLITKYQVHRNTILAALLTRYYKSSHRATTHNVLKHAALNMWGSPQLKTSKNTWLVNVSEDVVSMVLRWFAKDDLEHFFKLLKTEDGVDQRRLDFWIEYVDQIAFTRIVLGRDALYNNSTDFKQFRYDNKGRLSELLSATASNNAFIMQIKDYWFVEFSETGNACYVYHESSLPFDPSDRNLDLKLELKSASHVDEKIYHSGDWETKAQYILRRLKIYY